MTSNVREDEGKLEILFEAITRVAFSIKGKYRLKQCYITLNLAAYFPLTCVEV